MDKPVVLAFSIKLFVSAIGVGFLCSCAATSSKHLRAPAVREVDFSAAPLKRDLAERAKLSGELFYPQVCALLNDGDSSFPRQFEICLKPRLRSGNLAEARMTQICLNGEHLEQFERDPAYLDDVLVHEMAHVAQRYYRPIIGRWVVFDPQPPAYWVEGIADYVCFKLGQTNAWRCAECGPAYPHYSSGYSCAGAFLLFIEERYNPGIVPQLNTVLRQGRYTDAFFAKTTGKDLPSLWAEFQQTAAFTPGAAWMLKLQQELGYANGKPPKDIEQRVEQYVEQYTDRKTRRLMERAQVPGLKGRPVQTRLAVIHYFTQPGGTAEAYLIDLQETQGLPGIPKGEHGTLTGFLHHRDFNARFPAVRTFTAKRVGDSSTYHYAVCRATQESGWKLERAWRTNPDGSTAEEYSVTSDP